MRLGREDATSIRRFGVGSDIVLWKPDTEGWAGDLIAAHWKETQICWAVLVDGRETTEVVRDTHSTWPRRYAKGDIMDRVFASVGPQRKVAMVSYDGSFFSGKAFAACWETVLGLLKETCGGEIETSEGDDASRA